MVKAGIFAGDYREYPFWWEGYEPGGADLADVPAGTRVAIIGAGYTGLATALELAKLGIEATVFDAHDPGFGASTRSGRLVGGISSVKKPLIGRSPDPDRSAHMMSDAADGLTLLEKLIADEKIACGWHKTGRFTGAWSRSHFKHMQSSAEQINRVCDAKAHVVSRDQQREEIGSDYYFGGMVTQEAAHLHPALYLKGLLEACQRRGITICAHAGVEQLQQTGSGWTLQTARGPVRAHQVVIATNGYTGAITPQFKRRLIQLRPYIIATEPLPPDLAQSLSPKNRSFADTRRVVSFFRLSCDGRRMIFGSRVKWRDLTPSEMAPHLYRLMLDRYPQLRGARISHAWTGNVALTLDEQPHVGELEGLHYALGCNGSGVAMMTYLGTQLARKIGQIANYTCAFDTDEFPTHPLYNGNARWALPPIGNYLRFRDWLDRKLG